MNTTEGQSVTPPFITTTLNPNNMKRLFRRIRMNLFFAKITYFDGSNTHKGHLICYIAHPTISKLNFKESKTTNQQIPDGTSAIDSEIKAMVEIESITNRGEYLHVCAHLGQISIQ
jgi:hypothetical protein